MLRIEASSVQEGNSEVCIDKVPDRCPLCHRSVLPQFRSAVWNGETGTYASVQVVFQCVARDCQRLFIATYYSRYPQSSKENFYLDFVGPTRPKSVEFQAEVEQVSPRFVKIYNHAHFAEERGYSEVVGIGLRRALEFLVKDFAIGQKPEQEDSIRRAPLASVIKDHIDDPRIRTCAERAAWLGNDEAHYIRKWEEKDVDDLKLLITLTVNWIHNVLLTDRVEQEMPEKR